MLDTQKLEKDFKDLQDKRMNLLVEERTLTQNINESIKQLSSIDDEDVKTFLKELSEIESESDLENLVVKYTKKQQEIVEQIEKAHKYCNELLQNID